MKTGTGRTITVDSTSLRFFESSTNDLVANGTDSTAVSRYVQQRDSPGGRWLATVVPSSNGAIAQIGDDAGLEQYVAFVSAADNLVVNDTNADDFRQIWAEHREDWRIEVPFSAMYTSNSSES